MSMIFAFFLVFCFFLNSCTSQFTAQPGTQGGANIVFNKPLDYDRGRANVYAGANIQEPNRVQPIVGARGQHEFNDRTRVNYYGEANIGKSSGVVGAGVERDISKNGGTLFLGTNANVNRGHVQPTFGAGWKKQF